MAAPLSPTTRAASPPGTPGRGKVGFRAEGDLRAHNAGALIIRTGVWGAHDTILYNMEPRNTGFWGPMILYSIIRNPEIQGFGGP